MKRTAEVVMNEIVSNSVQTVTVQKKKTILGLILSSLFKKLFTKFIDDFAESLRESIIEAFTKNEEIDINIKY